MLAFVNNPGISSSLWQQHCTSGITRMVFNEFRKFAHLASHNDRVGSAKKRGGVFGAIASHVLTLSIGALIPSLATSSTSFVRYLFGGMKCVKFVVSI